MMQYVYSLIYARHVYEFAPIWSISWRQGQTFSMGRKKEQGRIHYDEDDVLLEFFPRYFPLSSSSSASYSSLFFSSHFYDVYVQDRPIHQTIILHSVEFLTKEYCLEIECRPMLRPRSVMNHGFLSIHMLSLVHFHHDIHLNTLPVVVSTKKKGKRNKYIAWACYVCVSADYTRGQSLFTHWRVQTITTVFFFRSPSIRSFSFLIEEIDSLIFFWNVNDGQLPI